MPVYLVKGPEGEKERLVDAPTRQAAINHVVGEKYDVKPVATSQLVAMINANISIETAATPVVSEKTEASGDGR